MSYRADLIIADGKNLLWRTHDVDQHRFARDGSTAIGGAEGFLRLLHKLKRELGGVVVVAWEGRGVNWRMAVDPEYKANRGKRKPEQVAEHEAVMRQVPILQGLLSKLGVRQWQGVDCEGDDVMATLCERAVTNTRTVAGHAGFTHAAKVMIYSKDRDLLQLVSDDRGVRQCMPEKSNGAAAFMDRPTSSLGRFMEEQDVIEVVGVPANRVTDYKGLAGDTGDNIPGVPGIGHKKAVALIERFGDLDAILHAAADGLLQDNVKLRDKLLDHVDLARRCKLLASVRGDAEIEELPRSRSEDDAHAAMLDLGMMSLCVDAEFRRMMEIGV
jgi:5'-3' exonuclease